MNTTLLPNEVIQRLNTAEGKRLLVIESPDGTFQLTPPNREFQEKMNGNKRTGFIVAVLFLELNGFDFTASEAEAAQAVLELAAGTIDETGLALFLRDHVKRAHKRAK
jgi:hypothetical protein